MYATLNVNTPPCQMYRMQNIDNVILNKAKRVDTSERKKFKEEENENWSILNETKLEHT